MIASMQINTNLDASPFSSRVYFCPDLNLIAFIFNQVQYELNLAKRGRASRTTVVDTNAQQPAAEKEGSDEPGA
jgi:hypothetical protein